MATINQSSSDDIIVPTNNGTTYRGLGGNDTYIISNAAKANASIVIVDTSGENIIQLVDGLSIASSKFAADAVRLTLSNGAAITINGSNNFSFELGGNATSGVSKVKLSFLEFSSKMGVVTLPVSGSIGGDSNVSVSGESLSGDIILINSDGSSVTPTSDSSSNNSVTKNASDNIIPSSGSSTNIKVTEDVIGGVLLDLSSLKIEKGSITVNSFGPISQINDLKYFDDYFLLDDTILKLKDGVNFNTDLSELINLKELTYFTNQTDEIFKISFSYRSEGIDYTHTVNITEFVDTPYGSGLYGDSAFILTDDVADNDVNSLIGPTKFVNTKSNTSEITEIFYSFPSANSEFIASDDTEVGLDLDDYYQSSDTRDILYDATDSFKSAVKDILDDTASIFKLKFTELTGENADKASIRFILWDSEASIPAGYSTGPQDQASFVFITKPSNNDYSPGTYVYGTIRHELGHALGLVHPFDGDNLISSEFNSELYTIMAYSSVYDTINNNPYDIDGFALTNTLNNEVMSSKTWQIFDIAALKYLYGIREIYNSSNNTYSFKNEASLVLIHDLGGYDTIDLSGSSANNDIKTFQIDLGGGAFYQAGNKTMIWEDDYQTGAVFTTSFDTKIEKFIGSYGIDNVILGPTSDTIITNGGDDTIASVGIYKSPYLIKVDAGSGDDLVNVFIETGEVNSFLDINGGSGYDYLRIFTSETDIDLTIYMQHFDNFENFAFYDSKPQTITIDAEDFIKLNTSYIGIVADDEDTVILPKGAILDTSKDGSFYDYYVLNDITIAISDNLIIG